MVSQSKGRFQSDDDDPLTKAMAPPPNETETQRAVRLAAEKEAQRRSDAIDEELNRQRINDKKTNCVKVLLLGECSVCSVHFAESFSFILTHWTGQSESGMSHH